MSRFSSFLFSPRPHKLAREMAPNLTIRNVTNVPLQLVTVEHFDPQADHGGFDIKNVTRGIFNVTNSLGMTNATTRKAVPQIEPNAQPFEKQDVNIQLPPFTIVSTDIRSEIRHSEERLRLTLQNEHGERHQMYCPVPTTETQGLIPITGNPQMHLVGIYLPEHAFAAVYSDSDLHAWMGKLADDLPLGLLSIPGTHNSPTHFLAAPSVRCQAVAPLEQLQNGVRFFDLRVQVPDPFKPNEDKLNLVHGDFPISGSGTKYFRDLFNDCIRFLNDNRSETLMMSLKREGKGKGSDEQLAQILKQHYIDPDQGHWFTEPRVPLLHEARGRIVLVRRFNLAHDAPPLGIDAGGWADNTPDAKCPSDWIRVQDFYDIKDESKINQKITYARDELERSGATMASPDDIHAASSDPNNKRYPVWINFLSGSNFWDLATWPEKIAAKVNPAVVDHLCRNHMVGDGGRPRDGTWTTGVVVCDWVGLDGDWDLVRCIVGMNLRLQR